MDNVIPAITGTAFITAESTLILDPRDAFCWGYESILRRSHRWWRDCRAPPAPWRFLSRAMRLALVERAEIGGGATAAAMGHIVVLDDSPAQLALTRYSQSLWRQLASTCRRDAEYTAARHALGGCGR